MSFDHYNKKKDYATQLLREIEEELRDDQLKNFVKQKRASLEDDCFKIAVFGHYSVGKSKFLNALMGFKEQILVEDELASTATITRLRGAKNPEQVGTAEVVYKNGHRERIPLDELPKYSARNKNFTVENQIEEVLLNLDSEFLKNGIEIIDTPGFNSAYAIHTEIAKKFIEKSDASIFLFAANQAGSEVEFEFLKDVNQYINRIFFVMNKIDICYLNNEAPEDIIADLLEKMQDKGVHVDHKSVFPISAKKHQEGLTEGSEEKIKEGRFESFTNALSAYLTGPENIKDRLDNPFFAIQQKLDKEKKVLEEQLQASNQDGEELQKHIKARMKEIDGMENELQEKRRHVKNNVKSIVRNAKSQFEQLIPEIQQETRALLNDVTTEFDLELTDFSGIVLAVYDKFIHRSNIVRNNMELDIEQLMDEIIDHEKDGAEIKEKILDIIHNRLDLEKVDADIPEVNLEAMKDIDKELDQKKKQYEELRRRLMDVRHKREQHEDLLNERKKIEEDILRLKNRKDIELTAIGDIRPKTAKKTVTHKREREGIFGKIGNKLFGPKVVEEQEFYTDKAELEWANSEKEKMHEKYSTEVSIQEAKLKNQLQDIYRLRFDEFELSEVEDELNHAKSALRTSEEESYTKKQQMASKIIRVNVNQFYSQVEQVASDYLDDVQDYLNTNRKVIVELILQVLNVEQEKIEERKNNLYNIEQLAGKSPVELELEMNDLHTRIAEIIEVIKNIKDVRESF